MITKINTLIIVLFGLIFQSGKAQYISVDEGYSAQYLVENVLIDSPCANVFNFSVSGGNFTSGEKSYGYFDASGTGFPFENGIILSTGKINNAPGPNSFVSDDGNGMGWNGDADLNQALNISNSINATVLEFDFIPLGSTISFDYIFSSEEYHGTATCQYSDGFAFLLKEASATTYQNLAVLPGTTIPVKVTSVHPAISGGCPAQNEQYFDAFNSTNHPTNFNGQTKVLTAQANVIPGTTYHIKLVIADEGNYRYDSAIFLGGGSFNFGIDIGTDRLIATGNPLCQSETLLLNANQTGATGYQWFQNNIALVGETNPTYLVSSEGEYSVEINYGTSCQTTGEIKIEYATNLIVNQDTFTLCDADSNQDGKTVFDLNAITPNLFTNLPTNYSVSFFENSSSTTALPNAFTNTTAFNQTIYARIMNIQGCYTDYPVHLVVNTFSTIIIDEEVGLCENSPITLNAGSGFSSFTWNTTPVENTQTITVDTAGTYIVTLTNANNCSKTKTFTVTASGIATINDIIINDFSDNNTMTVDYSGLGIYEFSLNGSSFQNSPFFTNLNEGEYTVFVKDTKGCGIVSKSFYILNYPKYFTPNGDGINDTWYIKNLQKRNLENSTISIFDRYGKLLKQINSIYDGWDGTFNGNVLPSSDYWFVIELTNEKTVKGHFTLKR
ncbi:MAG TPA: choice-of-anchor L domain-containing protein [Flavobacterium sp.]|uniref:choice-of-anchor L domain-containing protein n=1 Tax=Flavobacterium sp. TaxID=239 RepID=UPI002B4B5A62|nr:choice-of-anchor L domain-containing protein [Flavobacterium sp.]HLO73526.1 choice-of-anchor L domain-containing protein [Flavobacterium sp.]